MTASEIYDQTVRVLPAEERLQLAKLILNDLSPDNEKPEAAFSERPGTVRDQEHLEALLLAGLRSGAGIEATPEYWENKRRLLLESHARGSQKA